MKLNCIYLSVEINEANKIGKIVKIIKNVMKLQWVEIRKSDDFAKKICKYYVWGLN